ncbi:hypothetical protein JVU11DRAFT_3454 [Chiua virens]|nr:hypothetical protein JVU11DRAFT_3454 [Chiua virens]
MKHLKYQDLTFHCTIPLSLDIRSFVLDSDRTQARRMPLLAMCSPEITTASQASAHIDSPASVHFPSPISYTTGAVSSHSSSPIPLPDLKQLKQVVLHRSLAQLIRRSTDLRVCQYEVPGGGVCRDKDCGELHLSRVSKEPSDAEVAIYVHGLLPRPWNGRCDVRAVEIALEGVRLRGGVTDVDMRVREALGGLGIPMS